MSIESAKAFIEKMKPDEAFKAKGIELTKDEVTSAALELTDRELDSVATAGGKPLPRDQFDDKGDPERERRIRAGRDGY